MTIVVQVIVQVHRSCRAGKELQSCRCRGGADMEVLWCSS